MSLNIKGVQSEAFPDRKTERVFAWPSVKCTFSYEKYVNTYLFEQYVQKKILCRQQPSFYGSYFETLSLNKRLGNVF